MSKLKGFILLELWRISFIVLPQLFLFLHSFKLPCLIAMAFLIKTQGYVVVCEERLIFLCPRLSPSLLSAIYLPNEKLEQPAEDLLIFVLL